MVTQTHQEYVSDSSHRLVHTLLLMAAHRSSGCSQLLHLCCGGGSLNLGHIAEKNGEDDLTFLSLATRSRQLPRRGAKGYSGDIAAFTPLRFASFREGGTAR